MKPAGFLLLAPAGLILIAANAAEPEPAKLSERLKQEIVARLPAYTPPPPAAAAAPETPAEADPNALELPKMTVRERRQPRIEPNDLLTPDELNKKFAREYLNSLKGLDALLNGFSIPLISPSLAARGRQLYRTQQMEDIEHIMKVAEKIDPKDSAEMRKKVREMKRTDEQQNRPAGGK